MVTIHIAIIIVPDGRDLICCVGCLRLFRFLLRFEVMTTFPTIVLDDRTLRCPGEMLLKTGSDTTHFSRREQRYTAAAMSGVLLEGTLNRLGD